MTRLDLSGAFAALPTPFDADGQIALGRLDDNLEKWNRLPLRGYVVGGSNGEFPLLSPDERVGVVGAVRRSAAPDRLVLAGSGQESTRGTVELTNRMAEAGADAVLVVTPSYYKSRMTGEALTAHYVKVADVSPVPVVLYNVPANTGVDLPAEAAIELSRHPHIAGLKESGGDVAKIGRILGACDPEFQVMAGSAGFYLGALSVGAVGCIAALANLASLELERLRILFHAGDRGGAAALQQRLVEANAAVTAVYGIPGLKAGLDLVGFYGGPVRSPLQNLTDDHRAQLAVILRRAGLLV